MKLKNILIGGFILVLVFVGGCAKTNKDELTKIVLPVGYIPTVQFAPFYIAIEKGYYEEVGLDVEMQYGFEIDGVSLVGSGDYLFAVASGEQVVLARDKGLPIVYVMNWYKDYPVGISALADSGINSLADLTGKTIGIPALQGASYIAYKGFENLGEFDPESVNLQVIGYTQTEMLSQGEVDAAVIYVANEPVALQTQGYEVVTFAIADFMSLIGNGIITNEKVIAENPELIESFISATLKAIEFAAQNPEETFEICKTFVPNLEGDTVQYQVLLSSIQLWTVNGGFSDLSGWEATNELIQSIELVSNEIPTEELFTNDFLK